MPSAGFVVTLQSLRKVRSSSHYLNLQSTLKWRIAHIVGSSGCLDHKIKMSAFRVTVKPGNRLTSSQIKCQRVKSYHVLIYNHNNAKYTTTNYIRVVDNYLIYATTE